MTLEQLRRAAAPVCAELGVRRLDVFGSLARGEARAESDIDLVVEFASPDAQLHKRCYIDLKKPWGGKSTS